MVYRADGMLKDLPISVYNLQKGSETGKYLTVDLGGTKPWIGLVELLGSGQFTFKRILQWFRMNLKLERTRNIQFPLLGTLRKFLEHPENWEAGAAIEAGILLFSFPVQQESLAHGQIPRME